MGKDAEGSGRDLIWGNTEEYNERFVINQVMLHFGHSEKKGL
jgi:hypothetical protein